ncbi:hypothetical protein E8E13_005714 [Curvularia kusanoi]|uniref:Uncharacterized protein n=1 Tax=Curvularia kusanoi TaxID=90978 RepID=A0A9P4WDF9_CURKU|nr:hypothetical protein E8E13_005714 [Curvularia kusanoi]
METNMALLADLNQDDFCNEDTKREQRHAALREWFAPPPPSTPSSNTSTAMTTAQRPQTRNSHTSSSMPGSAPALVPVLAPDPDDDEDAEITALYRRLNALKSSQPCVQHTSPPSPPTDRIPAPPAPEARLNPTVPAVINSANSTIVASMPSQGPVHPFTPHPPQSQADNASAVEALETSRCISHANARLSRIIASVLAEEAAYSHATQRRELLARRLVVTNLAADADYDALMKGFGGWGGYV